ncbi:MAG: tetratricopeptide repeat protein [Candidatus Acidiferrales bacterium]
MKFSLAVVLSALLATGAIGLKAQDQQAAQQKPPDNYTGIVVEPDQELFATMCALDAAGFAADEGTLSEMPSRLALREDMLKMQGPATEALRAFYRDHLLADPGETLSRYITFSLVIGPPPRFDFQVNREVLPPDALALQGFREILAAFYQEARLDLQWAKVQPEYERAAAMYQPPVRKIVFATNGYLRELLKPVYNRSFTVNVEPLVGARTNFRNNGDHYAIVVGAPSQLPVDQIRHAYLHFMLDPLPLRFRKQVESKRALLLIASRAPRLPEEYRQDFLAFADECFVKSVELRLRRLPPPQLEAAMADADQSGFILVRPFVAQLQKFEKAEPAMSYYFPDLIAAIDVPSEQKRLQAVKFAPENPVLEPKPQDDSEASDLDRLLAQGDREIALQNAEAASATFESVLAKYPGQPKAEYGLAIASVMAGNAERAEQLFAKLVSVPAPQASVAGKPDDAADPSILSWSHVYLGRIHDLEGERDAAVHEYLGALAVEGAPEAARVAAQRGVDEPYKARAHSNAGEYKNQNGNQQQHP